MTVPLRAVLLALLFAAPSAVSAPGPGQSTGDLADLLGTALTGAGEREEDGSRDRGEHVRVAPCTAPGPACETGPIDVAEYVRLDMTPGFVGTAHVDLMRNGHTVQRITCTSTGLGATACERTGGDVPPGAYLLRTSADVGTVGAWAVMIRYA